MKQPVCGACFRFLAVLFVKKKTVNTTWRWELVRAKVGRRVCVCVGGEGVVGVPQRSINTLKALKPKSITITLSHGQKICLVQFHAVLIGGLDPGLDPETLKLN